MYYSLSINGSKNNSRFVKYSVMIGIVRPQCFPERACLAEEVILLLFIVINELKCALQTVGNKQTSRDCRGAL